MCWVGVGGKGLWCEEEQRCVCVCVGGGGGGGSECSILCGGLRSV